jgi:hypothetical protein
MNKYEQLIEFIINEQEDKARELFHQIVVEKSRDIYENLIDETDVDEAFRDGDQVENLMKDIDADGTTGLPEAGDDMDDSDAMLDLDDGMDDGMEMDMDPEAGVSGMDDNSGMEMDDGSMEDRVMDLEDALDELKAEFDKLMAGEEGDEEHGDSDFDMDDSDEEAGEEESDKDDVVMEYVNKVGHDWDKNANKAEGKAVGARADSVTGATHTKSPGKQGGVNMGGKSFDLGKGTESAPDGQRPTGKAGGFVKPAQEIDVAKRNVNKPGGNKGAQNYFDKKETSYEKARGAEGQTTDGKLPVNPKALQGGKVR